jgi:ubiquinone/menaquinone biosynthesis C-methylase UbiE
MSTAKEQRLRELRNSVSNDRSRTDLADRQFVVVANWINGLAPNARILELGCGSGRMAALLTGTYAGVDPIRHDNLCAGFDFRLGSGASIPHENGSFDYVLIKDAINYFSDLNPVIREALRVLSPSGAILATEFVGSHYAPLKQRFKNLIKKHLNIHLNPWDSTYANFYTSQDVVVAAKRMGLTADYCYVRDDLRYYIQIRRTKPIERPQA